MTLPLELGTPVVMPAGEKEPLPSLLRIREHNEVNSNGLYIRVREIPKDTARIRKVRSENSK